ncbi:MAG: hypothetical protein HYV09_26035 [Deltaproteobacteria bacterium]|nr:hypothetical protein [Deltaproteobacteria bacterium]
MSVRRGAPLAAAVNARIAEICRTRFGLELPDARARSVEVAVGRAVEVLAERDATTLLGRVERGDERALDVLAEQLTIGETYFLRDPQHFAFVREVALPDAARRGRREPVLWSAGCATGEEAYSLAIAAVEALGPASSFVVIGTDVNERFLERARAGWYGRWSFRGVDEQTRERWFVPEGRGFRVSDHLRARVRFARVNLVDPGPERPRGVDVVFCRNVLIYFDGASVARAARHLVDSLLIGGWLVPGPSDPMLNGDLPLAAVRLPGLVAYRREAPAAQARRMTGPPAIKALHAPSRRSSGATTAAARSLADAGDAHAARRIVDDVLRDRPEDVEAYVLRATLRYGDGDDEGALDDLRAATQLDRTLPIARLLAAMCHTRRGDQAAAARSLREAMTILGDAPDDSPTRAGGGMTNAELRATCARLLRARNGEGRRR